jgi:hypothetical protein
MKRVPFLVVATAAGAACPALAQHDWSIVSVTPGTTGEIGLSEDHLVTGEPWDTDGTDDCPPKGDDDVRCVWLEHVGGKEEHGMNGVLAAIMDGSQVQSATFLSEQWPDAVESGSLWWIDYDVHYVAVDAADITNLRVQLRFEHAGQTRLNLFLTAPPGTSRVRFRVASTHFWTESPETGEEWRIRAILSRTQPGSPAMIWLDNLEIEEDPTVLFEEHFPLACPADFDGSGDVGFTDLVQLLAAWGCSGDCPEDLDASGTVDFEDLLTLLGSWGACA